MSLDVGLYDWSYVGGKPKGEDNSDDPAPAAKAPWHRYSRRVRSTMRMTFPSEEDAERSIGGTVSERVLAVPPFSAFPDLKTERMMILWRKFAE